MVQVTRLTEIWSEQPPEIQAALIAAVVSLVTAILTLFATFILTPLGQYLISKRQLRYNLRTEHEYEQRKRLADTINRYRGLILKDADIMKTRIFNLYGKEEKRWLRVPEREDGSGANGKDYRATGYYYRTTVYRFLAVTTSVQRFEDEALYVDSEIAEKEHFEFVYGLKLLQKAATDVSLFEGIDYDDFESRDHIFSDTLRVISESCWREDRFLTRDEFGSLLGEDDKLDPVLEFFDDLKAKEDRLRWDRLVIFHLLLTAFINAFGYEFQRTNPSELADVVARIEHDVVCKNLAKWLQEYRLLNQSTYGKNLQAISDMVTRELERRGGR
jgi:hypothetical protein